MRTLATLLATLLLGGCAGIGLSYPPSWEDATAEQIKAVAAIKDAGVSCIVGVYAGATLTHVIVNVDKGVPTGLTLKSGCEMVFDAGKPPK